MVEAQAIARVNRLGQKRNVRVVRYIIKGTVEEVRFSLYDRVEEMTKHYSWNCKHSKYAS
jgi:SNF2 family DNA or RNA helicase